MTPLAKFLFCFETRSHMYPMLASNLCKLRLVFLELLYPPVCISSAETTGTHTADLMIELCMS